MTHDQVNEMFEAAFDRLVAIHNPAGTTAPAARRCWVCKQADAQSLLGLCEPCADQRLGLVLRAGRLATD